MNDGRGLPIAFIAYTILSSAAHSLWYTLFPLHLRSLGLPLWEIGLAASLPLTLNFVMALPAGFAADALSALVSLAAASAGQLAAVALLSLGPPVPAAALALLLYTFLSTLRSQGSLRLIALGATASSWGMKYSMYLLAAGASAALGSYFSGLIAEKVGFEALYTASAVALACSLLPLLKLQEASPAARAAPRSRALRSAVLRGSGFLELTSSLSLHDFAVFALMPYTALFQQEVLHLKPHQIGFISAVSTAISQALQPVAGYLTDRVGAKKALAVHYVGISAGYALIGLSRRFEELVLAAVVQSAFLPFDIPARRKLLSLMAPSGSVATANGLSDTIVGIVAAPSPLLGSQLWHSFGARWTFVIVASLNLASLGPLSKLKEGSSRT